MSDISSTNSLCMHADVPLKLTVSLIFLKCHCGHLFPFNTEQNEYH